MSDINMTLSPEEKECLLRILEGTLASKRVEVHRTDSLAYRQYVEHELELVDALVSKLRPNADIVKAV